MISNLRKNRMGTVSFDGKFVGMRKAQDFIVYPMKGAETHATVQSDTRIGEIDLTYGVVKMSPPRQGGSYGVHLAFAREQGQLTAEELLLFKAHIFATAHGMAGTNGIVYCDNSGAADVFGASI